MIQTGPIGSPQRRDPARAIPRAREDCRLTRLSGLNGLAQKAFPHLVKARQSGPTDPYSKDRAPADGTQQVSKAKWFKFTPEEQEPAHSRTRYLAETTSALIAPNWMPKDANQMEVGPLNPEFNLATNRW